MRTLVGIVLVVVLAAPAQAAGRHSLRFFGTGSDDVDRVKIRVDDPKTDSPGPPADVGATDFTIELWLRAASGNRAKKASCRWNIAWIEGNIVVDRDRYNQGRKFGMSLAGGRVAWGVTNKAGVSRTICGTSDLRDGKWHHVAIQRRRSDGMLWVWVDGVLERRADGPNGNVSYPNSGKPGNYCGGPCTNSDPFLVVGAEKHDAGSAYPSFHGWVDEIRLSTKLRYRTAFEPRAKAFALDKTTAALYHLNEGSGTKIHDAVGASPGIRRVGGDHSGPRWSSASPL
jgi:hypothetical protein